MYIYNNVGAKLQISIYTQQHYRKISVVKPALTMHMFFLFFMWFSGCIGMFLF